MHAPHALPPPPPLCNSAGCVARPGAARCSGLGVCSRIPPEVGARSTENDERLVNGVAALLTFVHVLDNKKLSNCTLLAEAKAVGAMPCACILLGLSGSIGVAALRFTSCTHGRLADQRECDVWP